MDRFEWAAVIWNDKALIVKTCNLLSQFQKKLIIVGASGHIAENSTENGEVSMGDAHLDCLANRG